MRVDDNEISKCNDDDEGIGGDGTSNISDGKDDDCAKAKRHGHEKPKVKEETPGRMRRVMKTRMIIIMMIIMMMMMVMVMMR